MKRHLWATVAIGVIILAVTGLNPANAVSLSGNWCEKEMFDQYGSICPHIPRTPANINKGMNETWVKLKLVGDTVKIRFDWDHGQRIRFTLKLNGLSLTGVAHDIHYNPRGKEISTIVPANGIVSSDGKTITISLGGYYKTRTRPQGWILVFKRV